MHGMELRRRERGTFRVSAPLPALSSLLRRLDRCPDLLRQQNFSRNPGNPAAEDNEVPDGTPVTSLLTIRAECPSIICSDNSFSTQLCYAQAVPSRKRSSVPLYVRIAETFTRQIAGGVFRPGDRVPSLRKLSREQGVSLST